MAGGSSAGSFTTGSNNTALGLNAGTGVAGSDNFAGGSGAGAGVTGSHNVAVGTNAGAGVGATNTISVGTNALASVDGATAIGFGAQATGANAIAIGTNAVATGSIGMGNSVVASNGGAAYGDFSTATGRDSTAVGPNSTATHRNSAAFGNGATTTRNNQQVFGTDVNTYTTPGITSTASRNAQSGSIQAKTIEVVTSDQNGNLATDGGYFQSQIDALGQRDKELAEGIAISLALAQPMFQPGQSFAMRVGWGNFDGSNAVGVTGAGVLAKNAFGPGTTVVLDGGIGWGSNENQIAGRAGLTFGW
jgi:hypothetical protein